MVCRAGVRIRHNENIVETSALVNSGFESDSPDIVIPIEVVRDLVYGLLEKFIGLFYVAEIELVLGDRESRRVIVNVIVNPHIHEVILSNYVSSLFGIILLYIKKGLWKFVDDPRTITRASAMLGEW